jgi:hypothetical protein
VSCIADNPVDPLGPGFLLSRGKFTTINHPKATLETAPYGINNRGKVVGGYDAAGFDLPLGDGNGGVRRLLSGEALLIVEGQERPLRQWDFVHCPPETNLVIVGAGDGPCVILAMSSREFQASGPRGWYAANELARRYGASPEEDTQEADDAYANVPDSVPTRYREGSLPSTSN